MLKAPTVGEQGVAAVVVGVEEGRAFGRPGRGLRVSRSARRMRTVFDGNVEQDGESLVRRVNVMIRKRFPLGYAQFFRECGDACFRTVWLDVLDSDSVIAVPNAAILAGGHGQAGTDESTEEG